MQATHMYAARTYFLTEKAQPQKGKMISFRSTKILMLKNTEKILHVPLGMLGRFLIQLMKRPII
jgi:hypothetical protein